MPQNNLKTYQVTTTKKDFVILAENFTGNQNFTGFFVGGAQVATFNNAHIIAVEDMDAIKATAPEPEEKKKAKAKTPAA